MVLRLGGGFCILADGGTILTSNDALVSASPTIGLRFAASSIDLEQFEGRKVVATGYIDDHDLAISSADSLSLSPEPSHAIRVPVEPRAKPVGTGRLRQTLRVRPAVERALLKEGLLLDVWEADRGSGAVRWIALATDVEKARAALSAHYRDSLEVVESRWDDEILRDIESILVDDDLVVSFGRGISPDLQMTVTAILLYLPTRLARRLGRFPPAALDIAVLARPA